MPRALPVATGVAGGEPRELTCSPDGPLAAEVVHTRSDPYVGHVSLVRVFSGTLQPSSAVHISGHLDRLDPSQATTRAGHDEDLRVGTVGAPRGAEVVELDRAVAGQVVVVTRLSTAATTDTISSPEDPLLVEPWALPDALLPVALEPVTRHDEDKLGTALRELAAEDSALRVERDTRTDQDVLWTTGVAHQELVLSRLKERFAVDVRTAPVKVGLRETFTGPAAAQGRHVKQSGGHGQFAVCHLEVAPGGPGSGIVFTERVVGGAVPKGYIPSVEKGARAQLAAGLLAGWPVTSSSTPSTSAPSSPTSAAAVRRSRAPTPRTTKACGPGSARSCRSSSSSTTPSRCAASPVAPESCTAHRTGTSRCRSGWLPSTPRADPLRLAARGAPAHDSKTVRSE